MSLQSPLARVLGHGSAKEGTDHWWAQRVSAIGLAILGTWFLISLLGLPGFDRATVVAWIGAPLNSVLLILLSVTLAYHARLGVQVIIEDYVHGPLLKVVSLILSSFAHIFLGMAAVFAVLKIAFGGAA